MTQTATNAVHTIKTSDVGNFTVTQLPPGDYSLKVDKDGFQVYEVYPCWGIGNVFRANDAQVNGPGHGYYVQNKRLQTLVACNNEVSGAAGGLSTIVCTPL